MATPIGTQATRGERGRTRLHNKSAADGPAGALLPLGVLGCDSDEPSDSDAEAPRPLRPNLNMKAAESESCGTGPGRPEWMLN